jgi:glycosyltransferase involved in cell wall biosynthesis
MIIGIDASRSNVKQKTGTEYYSQEIIKNIVKMPTENIFRLYSKTPLDYLKKAANLEFKVMPFPKLWSQFRLSFEMLQNSPEVLFVPAHTIPIIHPKKIVTTLHDVGFRYFPELYTPLERIYHNWSMGFAVKHATKIIAISEATKKDLIKFYGADEKKITVIYHGYDKEKFVPKKGEAPEPIKKLGDYIYFIGRLEAKKNIKTLIKAYGILRQDEQITAKLVLAGRPGYLYEEIKEHIDELPEQFQKDIIEPGYIPDEIMADYLKYAKVFAFPSKFEGFGMPLVEAMACGVPVVAANCTSIPEICADAALLHKVEDEKELADQLKKVLTDEKLRNDLIHKGFERIKIFDWEKSAEKTLEVINEAVK